MPTEAEVLLSKLPTNKLHRSSYKSKISTEKALLNFSVYLEGLVREHARKYTPKNLPNLIPSIYRDKYIFNNETDFVNFNRDTICIASTCFKEMLSQIYNSKIKITYHDILPYKELIRAFIFDLKPHVNFFEQRKDKSYEMFGGGKFYKIHPFELNKLSNNLYWESSLHNKKLDQRLSLNLSCFTIRQSLEIRFRNALGIHQLLNNNYTTIKLPHDFIPNFIDKNRDHFNLPNLSLVSLMQIYRWTNKTIHTGVSPKVWEVQFALKYINTFFNSHEIKRENSKPTLQTLYGSVQIKSYETLKEKLKTEISISLRHNNYIIKFTTPEAVLLD